MSAESIARSSGRRCVLESFPLPGLAPYHVLSFPAEQGQPSIEEAEEVVRIATRKARELGRRWCGDDECFSLIWSGTRTRRRPCLHIHILPTPNLAAKRLAILAFCCKRLLRRWPLRELWLALRGDAHGF